MESDRCLKKVCPQCDTTVLGGVEQRIAQATYVVPRCRGFCTLVIFISRVLVNHVNITVCWSMDPFTIAVKNSAFRRLGWLTSLTNKDKTTKSATGTAHVRKITIERQKLDVSQGQNIESRLRTEKHQVWMFQQGFPGK